MTSADGRLEARQPRRGGQPGPGPPPPPPEAPRSRSPVLSGGPCPLRRPREGLLSLSRATNDGRGGGPARRRLPRARWPGLGWEAEVRPERRESPRSQGSPGCTGLGVFPLWSPAFPAAGVTGAGEEPVYILRRRSGASQSWSRSSSRPRRTASPGAVTSGRSSPRAWQRGRPQAGFLPHASLPVGSLRRQPLPAGAREQGDAEQSVSSANPARLAQTARRARRQPAS